VKVTILVFFVIVGATAFDSDNLSPWAPHGTSGVIDAASLIFFAYIGFDAVSTTAEETRRPARDLPIGIIGSLVIATILYILVALAATGMAPAAELDGSDSPLADAIRIGGAGDWAGDILSFGALVAITSVVLTVFYGQTRIAFTMSRDGLMPRWLTKLTPRRTPARITLCAAVPIIVLAGLVPLSEIAELVNIGTLFAFLVVNLGVVILRRTEPDMQRGFRVPLAPVTPLIGAALCVYLMSRLPGVTWLRFGIWLAVGLVIYTFYGRHHSLVQRGEAG
jgi:APA family basic amino acid/polyamine antiporter